MDFAYAGAIGFTLVKTTMPWTMAGDATLLAEVVAWLAGVAVLGTLLGRLRFWCAGFDQQGVSPEGAPSLRSMRGGRALRARPLAVAGRALLLLMAPALLEWLVVVPRAHAEPTRAAAVVRLP